VVLAPSTPADNRALLAAAIACDDPVVYLEHKNLWPLRGEVPEVAEAEPIGKARRVRAGGDLTLVSWSATVHEAERAAELLAAEGISVELFDLRSLWPWDREAVLGSAARTGRLLVAHEAVRDAGFGAEIAATVAEELAVPVARVAAPRLPVPYSPPLEAELEVDAGRIARAARRLLERRR
jgi:pyruvate dehydrogenase E1 component beta subunit